MRGVATLQDPNNTHSTREEHALSRTKGMRSRAEGKRRGKTMDHLISLSAWMWLKGRGTLRLTIQGGAQSCVLWDIFRRLQLPAACMEKRNGSASFAGASARDVVPRDITGLARASCTAFLAQRPLRRPNTPGGRHGRTIKTMERIHSYGQSPITGEHVPASMQTPYDSTVNAGKSSARASASVRLASCNLNCERGGGMDSWR